MRSAARMGAMIQQSMDRLMEVLLPRLPPRQRLEYSDAKVVAHPQRLGGCQQCLEGASAETTRVHQELIARRQRSVADCLTAPVK